MGIEPDSRAARGETVEIRRPAGNLPSVTVDGQPTAGNREFRRRPVFPAHQPPALSLTGTSLRRLVIAIGLAEVLLIVALPTLFLVTAVKDRPVGIGIGIGIGVVLIVAFQYVAIRTVLGKQIAGQRETRAFARLLDQTIEQEKLRIVFQPIFRASDGVQVGVEALTRFDVDTGMSPESWFGAAHTVGRTQQLEMVAVRIALRYAPELPAPLYLALNVSPDTFVSAELRAVVLDSPLPNERIVLELTEHVAINDYGPVVASRELFRTAGVRVAIDDTGAGFSSFRHVITVSPDIIKMDHSLAAGVDRDPLQSGLVDAVLTFARTAGIVVIAEGVETTGQLMRLTQLGVDQIQGHLLGAPTAPPTGRRHA